MPPVCGLLPPRAPMFGCMCPAEAGQLPFPRRDRPGPWPIPGNPCLGCPGGGRYIRYWGPPIPISKCSAVCKPRGRPVGGRRLGRPHHWSTWIIAEGGDDRHLLQAADAAGALSAQVAALTAAWVVTGTNGELLRPVCILTGDGKGMQAMNPGGQTGLVRPQMGGGPGPGGLDGRWVWMATSPGALGAAGIVMQMWGTCRPWSRRAPWTRTSALMRSCPPFQPPSV